MIRWLCQICFQFLKLSHLVWKAERRKEVWWKRKEDRKSASLSAFRYLLVHFPDPHGRGDWKRLCRNLGPRAGLTLVARPHGLEPPSATCPRYEFVGNWIRCGGRNKTAVFNMEHGCFNSGSVHCTTMCSPTFSLTRFHKYNAKFQYMYTMASIKLGQ